MPNWSHLVIIPLLIFGARLFVYGVQFLLNKGWRHVEDGAMHSREGWFVRISGRGSVVYEDDYFAVEFGAEMMAEGDELDFYPQHSRVLRGSAAELTEAQTAIYADRTQKMLKMYGFAVTIIRED